ncbi:MAG: hypothetical protein IT461_16530 [Planctomycetes bacterium]|nr:hypothetical protein [Planctomycetota bacterium]
MIIDQMISYADDVEKSVRGALQSTAAQRGELALSAHNIHRTVVADYLPRRALRQSGVFFTPTNWARRLVALAQQCAPIRAVTAFDPACGAGDLLLECARKAGPRKTIAGTLKFWGKLLGGADIHPSLVRATQLRLVALALHLCRGVNEEQDLDRLVAALPNFTSADYLAVEPGDFDWKIALMNPPFIKVPAPDGCQWASGSVNAAAVFLERALAQAKPNAVVGALLPDVLRTGTLYEGWRREIGSISRIHHCVSLGQFARDADVDVFLLVAKKTKLTAVRGFAWALPRKSAAELRVSSKFDVHVGAVVPHRHKKTGPLVPYLDAHDGTDRASVRSISSRRKFNGTLYKGPFVAIRRTSSPKDKMRARGLAYLGNQEVAVENHLIVAIPKKPSSRACKRLLRVLQCSRTNTWLNRRIRCRHLTVGSVEGLPLWGWK